MRIVKINSLIIILPLLKIKINIVFLQIMYTLLILLKFFLYTTYVYSETHLFYDIINVTVSNHKSTYLKFKC